MMIKLYHNPRCSKSRDALKALETLGLDIEVIEYLKNPLTISDYQSLKKQLAINSYREMMRQKESIYQENHLAEADEETLLQALVEHPILLERPIASTGHQAAIGRPLENILNLLKK
ncbi:arsenate reductase (glutaredoxin) [Basilea psittacipulmonis]|uniref:Arsenate reductase n=1 Tax=Basilea psittacipulmonis DSM 24701 TaxID=1072685 RepID=A0A077DBB7_9BURK|nr:arsenate reductase (glutaredoxin) [Basilea psittacipulmonis]AIL32150.1 hypothetical protein IX83_01370 [Basilea psittacipulmonis DSM 24701]